MLRNVVSFSEISAVNLIVGWELLGCSMNRLISCLVDVVFSILVMRCGICICASGMCERMFSIFACVTNI